MANDYCTVVEVKNAMTDTTWGVTYDVEIEALITACSRAIDQFMGREAGAFYVSADTTRYFDGPADDWLWIGELAAAPTSVAVALSGDIDSSAGTGGTYTAWTATDFLLWPYNALAEGKPYMALVLDTLNGNYATWYGFTKGIKIVGKFGYSATVPKWIKQATIIMAIRQFKRGQQAYQDTGAILELGQLRYVQKIDPDVAALLEAERRVTI